jgi:hypothetical protein
MTDKHKRDDGTGAPIEAGNTSSAGNPGELARPWTDEEMAAAKPFPLPKVRTLGVPYVGKGETKPAGQPKDDDVAR